MRAIKVIFFVALFFFASFANCKTAYSSGDLYFLYYQHVVAHKFNRFDAKLIIKAVNGCTKDVSFTCKATRKILEYQVRDGSESAALLLAAQLLEIDPAKNRNASDKMLNELLSHTKDNFLKNQITQLLALKVKTKQKSSKDNNGLSSKNTAAVITDTQMISSGKDTREDSDSSETESITPKRLTIIFGN